MKIEEFIKDYNAQKFILSRNSADERSEYFKKELEIKSYIPFREKRQIAEMIITQNIKSIDGIKKYDNINGYIGFIIASISAHTNLQFSEDPVADYDLLAESGLLPQIIAEFQGSHDEIDIILKMALAMELEDNNVNVLVGHFLNKILEMLDGVGGALKEKFDGFDPKSVLGADITKEDLAELSGFLDKLK